MNRRRKAWALVLTLLLSLILSGCTNIKEKLGIAFPAKQYVESILEAVYHGEYEAYENYTGEGTDAAQDYHEEYVEVEASYFAEYLHIDSISEKGTERLKKVIEALYMQARFQVQEPIYNNQDQMVEVVVYPVDFFGVAGEEINTYIKEFNQALADGEYAVMSVEEREEKYETQILDICEKYMDIPESDYQISVNLTIRERDGGYYQITDGFEKLDECVIQY